MMVENRGPRRRRRRRRRRGLHLFLRIDTHLPYLPYLPWHRGYGRVKLRWIDERTSTVCCMLCMHVCISSPVLSLPLSFSRFSSLSSSLLFFFFPDHHWAPPSLSSPFSPPLPRLGASLRRLVHHRPSHRVMHYSIRFLSQLVLQRKKGGGGGGFFFFFGL